MSGSLRDGRTQILPGSRYPFAVASNDLGEVSPDKAVRGITIVFSRSTEQEAALQRLILAQRDPTSPEFHHWLSPEEFGARFGVADADLTAVQEWLQSFGFIIDGVTRGHNRLMFSGTAGQIAAAFSSPLHRFRTGSSVHFAPAYQLHLPLALLPLVTTVERLTDYRPAPLLHPVATPQFTASSMQQHLLDPLDLATQYNMGPVTKTYDGTGETIAVVGQSWIPGADLAALHAVLLQGSGGPFTQVLVPNTGVAAAFPGDEAEADIDVEYSGGTAVGASIYLVYVGNSDNANVFTALSYAISQSIAPIISVSYGACEEDFSASDLSSIAQISEQATAQGQTIVAAAGDQGFNTCYGRSNLSTAQQVSASVSVPADLPDVTGVGGLQLAAGTFGAGNNQYFSAAGTQNSFNTLLSYVPEVVWNEDSSILGLAAGGGGVSSSIQRPSWQTGVPGIPAGSFRLVPDVALQASIQSPGFLFCSNDSSAFMPGQTSSCSVPQGGNFADELTNNYSVAGGTSFGAPILAGMLAILNQATNNDDGQGNINPILYSLASNSSIYSSAFHDVTSGSTVCASSATACAAVGQVGAAATPGYDEASGLGSINFANLVAAWPASSSTALLQTRTSPLPLSYNPDAGSTQQVNIYVGKQTRNTVDVIGNVELLLDGQVIATAVPLTPLDTFGSQATISYTAPSSTGVHVLRAIYAGDAQHSPSSGTNVITVGSTKATGSLSLAAGNVSLSQNSSTTVTVTINPQAGYAGVVKIALTNVLATSGSATGLKFCYLPNQVNTYAGPGSGTIKLGEGSACNAPTSSERMRLIRVRPLATQQTKAQQGSETGRFGAAALAAMLFGLLPLGGRYCRLPTLMAMFCIVVLGLTVVGCGGSSNGTSSAPAPTSPPAPTPTTVALTGTVTGVDSVNGTITATTNFTITLTQ